MLTQEILLREMDYRDGKLFWRVSKQGRQMRRHAGSTDREGYRRINFCGKMRFEHQLVWLYFTGAWPAGGLDHINRNPGDNRIENLRELSHRDNNLNKAQSDRELPTNIYRHHGRYRVDILYKNTRYKSKAFSTVVEAIAAREQLLLEAGLKL